MLPPHLRSTYRQYKEDTDRIATWLVITAKALGYDVLKHSTVTQKSNSDRKKQSVRPAEYTIPIKDFTTLASHIAKHLKPPSKVSQAVLGVITRAVQARKDSNEWFQKSENEVTSSDDGHTHFVGVLEQVYAILKPHSLTEAATKIQEEDLSLVNLLEGLELEDVSEDFERASAISTSASDTTKKVIIRAQPMKETIRLPFAAYMLLSDMNQVRSFVQELWDKYLAGQADLVSVSVTTDYATDLVRRLEEEFFSQFPKETPKTVLTMLYEMKCTLMDIAGIRKEEGSHASWHPAMHGIVHWLFFDVHEYLSIMAKAFPSTKGALVPYRPCPRSMFSNVFVASEDNCFMDRSEDEKADLINMFQECWLLTNFTKALPVEDELLKAVRHIVKTRNVPLWTLFTARLYLDVRNIMGSSIEVPFKQMQIVAAKAKQSVEVAVSNRKGCPNESWPFQKDVAVQKILMHYIDQWILTDGYNVLVKRHMTAMQYPSEDFRVLRQHPVLCGLMAFNVHLTKLNFGLSYMNAWGSGMFMAHLYNAVRQEKSCDIEWADMESFMDVHATECLFSNGRPGTPEDFYKRFALCMGASVVRYAREKSRESQFEHFTRKKGGARLLKEIGEVTKALKPRYCRNGGFVSPADAGVRRIWDPEMVDKMLNAENRAGGEQATSSRNASQPSPINVLKAMQKSISQELPSITFDYFTFHCTCWSILRAIEKLCRPKLLACLNHDYREDLDEARLPWIVGYILKIDARMQSDVSVRHPHAKLAGLESDSRIILPLVGHLMSQILNGPHVRRTQELDKIRDANSMFDGALAKNDLISTPKAAPSKRGDLRPPREHPTMHMWMDEKGFGYTDYQKQYFPHLAQQSLERMAGRPHSHLEPDGTRAAWFEATDDDLKCGIMNKASAPYLEEDRVYYGNAKNVIYLDDEVRQRVLSQL